MKRWLLLVPILALVGLSACSDIRQKKLTEENREKILSEAGTSKDLTDEEHQMIQGYILRQGIQNVFQGGKPSLPTGITVGEMIEEQRKWVALEKAEEEKQKRLAAEIAAKQSDMRNVIGVAIFNLAEREDYISNYVEAGFAYENRSARDVRAFQGHVEFKDVLGNKLEEIQLKVFKPTKAGEKASVTERLWSESYALRGNKLEDVKIEWKPDKILFADGTSVEVARND
jgi:hypothetical protein